MESTEYYEPFKDYFCELLASSALSGNIKDAKTTKYIVCDQVQATNYGFKSPEEIIGLTGSDLTDHLIEVSQHKVTPEFSVLEKNNVKEAISADIKVIMTGEPNYRKEIIPTASGIIHIGKMIKQPVFGKNKKILAICTTDIDITNHYSLSNLLAVYTQYFNPAQAVSNFLHYLRLVESFEKLPTLQELKLLIAMTPNASSKQVALQKGLKLRTVDSYKARIRRKLKTLSLGEILVQLRTRSQLANELSHCTTKSIY
jgi:DNA-binding CsgD family transcriptional regulator